MRWLVAAALLGCGSDPRDCSLTTVTAEYIGSAVIDDCGNLMSDGVNPIDTAAWQSAASCALDHAAQQHPFQVQWLQQGIEGPSMGAYVGMARDAQWTLAAFGQSSGIDGTVRPARRDTCSALRTMSPCGSLESTLCIECVNRVVADQCMP